MYLTATSAQNQMRHKVSFLMEYIWFEFIVFPVDCCTKAKEPSLPNYLSMGSGRRKEFLPKCKGSTNKISLVDNFMKWIENIQLFRSPVHFINEL